MLESFTDVSLTDLTGDEVEVLEDGWGGRQVVVVHLGDGQTEVFHLVVARIEAGQHSVVVVYPLFHIVLHVEVHHARTAHGNVTEMLSAYASISTLGF